MSSLHYSVALVFCLLAGGVFSNKLPADDQELTVEYLRELIVNQNTKLTDLERAFTTLIQTLHNSNTCGSKGEGGNNNETDISSLPIRELSGLRGAPGPAGRDGTDGMPGCSGKSGEKGDPGQTGLRGTSGVKGETGDKGRSGSTGTPGVKGSTGVQGPAGSSANNGAVYTRWGRTTCGSSSSLLYRGFAGGSYFSAHGGGSNYQCLPSTAEYRDTDSRAYIKTKIYGTEYETGDYPGSPENHNVPCARCYTGSRSATVMIPAMRSCSPGWTKEYEGYLMTEMQKSNRQRTTYECVDTNPEHIQGESADTDGALFYFVKAQCEGMGNTAHCPPYSSTKPLSCVVCTK